MIPHQLQARGVIIDPRAGTVGVGAEENSPGIVQGIDDAVRNTADHLPGRIAGGKKSVESVQHLGAGSAEETIAFDQAHGKVRAHRGAQGGTAPRCARTDHEHIQFGGHGNVAVNQHATQSAS